MGKVKVFDSPNNDYVGCRTSENNIDIVIPQRGPSKRIYFKAHYRDYNINNTIDPNRVMYVPAEFKWKYNKDRQIYYTEDSPGEGKYTFKDIMYICNNDKRRAITLLNELTGEHPVVLAHTLVKRGLFVPCDWTLREHLILAPDRIYMDIEEDSWKRGITENYYTIAYIESARFDKETRYGFFKSRVYRIRNQE